MGSDYTVGKRHVHSIPHQLLLLSRRGVLTSCLLKTLAEASLFQCCSGSPLNMSPWNSMHDRGVSESQGPQEVSTSTSALRDT